MRPSAIYFAIFTLGASGALAQGVSPLRMRPAPIGHRQQAPSDLPPDVPQGRAAFWRAVAASWRDTAVAKANWAD
jgi:hypothetical protein